MAEFEKIQVIVRERLNKDPFEKAIAAHMGEKPFGSTVAVKVSFGGKLYGEYIKFKKKKLTAADVEESVNAMLEEVIRGIKEDNNG